MSPVVSPRCPECQAENPTQATRCWLCHRSFAPGEEIVLAEIVPTPTVQRPAQKLLGLLTALVAVLVMVVGFGLARGEAFLLIPYTLVVGLGLAVTSLHEVRARVRGRTVGWGERLLTFIISVNAALAVLAVILVAAIVAFVVLLFLVCSGAIR